MFETRKILEDDAIGVSVTCVRVPVRVSHSLAVNVQTREPLSASDAQQLVADAPGVTLDELPTPLKAEGRDDVLVGRIRDDASHPRALNMWVVGDNLRKGAATNAIQIAELLVRTPRVLTTRNQLAPRPDAELAVDPPCVRADGLDADVQRLGDLAVRVAGAEQLEHVGLARREQLRARWWVQLDSAGREDVQSAARRGGSRATGRALGCPSTSTRSRRRRASAVLPRSSDGSRAPAGASAGTRCEARGARLAWSSEPKLITATSGR